MNDRTESQETPDPYKQEPAVQSPYSFKLSSPPPRSVAAFIGLLLGLLALLFNVLLVTLPLGLLLGIISLAVCAYARRRHGVGLNGIIASGLSFLIALIWLISMLVPILVDPTLTFTFPFSP
jgi:hypothetical protein